MRRIQIFTCSKILRQARQQRQLSVMPRISRREAIVFFPTMLNFDGTQKKKKDHSAMIFCERFFFVPLDSLDSKSFPDDFPIVQALLLTIISSTPRQTLHYFDPDAKYRSLVDISLVFGRVPRRTLWFAKGIVQSSRTATGSGEQDLGDKISPCGKRRSKRQW